MFRKSRFVIIYVSFASLLMSLAACSDQRSPPTEPVSTQAPTTNEANKLTTESNDEAGRDHDQIYLEGAGLIKPYMQLVGKAAKPANKIEDRQTIERGIARLRQALEMEPDNYAAHWIIGKGYQAMQDHKNACDAFGMAFSIEKNNADVAREYMFECLNLGRTSPALEAAQHANQVKPNDPGLIANLALAYLMSGMIDQAVATVERSLGLAPDDPITKNLQQIILEVRDGKRLPPKTLNDL